MILFQFHEIPRWQWLIWLRLDSLHGLQSGFDPHMVQLPHPGHVNMGKLLLAIGAQGRHSDHQTYYQSFKKHGMFPEGSDSQYDISKWRKACCIQPSVKLKPGFDCKCTTHILEHIKLVVPKSNVRWANLWSKLIWLHTSIHLL